jgi:PLP dependent protein
LSERLTTIYQRIVDACADAGRSPAEVTLLAMTKTVSAQDVVALLDLGLTRFGENSAEAGAAKADRVGDLRPGYEARWHLTGSLSQKMVGTAAMWASRVESVDSVGLADALDAAVQRAREAGTRNDRLPVLVQYSVDGDPSHGGVPAAALMALAEHVASRPQLVLSGLMAIENDNPIWPHCDGLIWPHPDSCGGG